MENERYVYAVQMPLDGANAQQLYTGEGWYNVANAITPEAAGEVVSALCRSNKHGQIRVTIQMVMG